MKSIVDDAVLDLLQLSPSRVVTADAMAASIGCHVRTVYRSIERLRAKGHRIGSSSGFGYMLMKQKKGGRAVTVNTIWKFKLEIADAQMIQMPAGAHIMSVGLDPANDLCIWAAVDKDAPPRLVDIRIVSTGDPLPHLGDFIGSVTRNSSVWHVFTGPGDAVNKASFHYQTAGND